MFAVDVTEQVRSRRQTTALQAQVLAAAQRQAQERQDLYQVFEQTPAAIVLLREPDHRLEYFNPAFAALFPAEGWANSALKGHTLAQVYPQMQEAGLVRLLDRVFETGEPQVVLEMPLAEWQPGNSRYVTFTYQAYREQGRIVGVAAFIYDVTEQVLARQTREAQQRLVETLFAQAPTAIWVVQGPAYVVELVNPLIAQLLGHPASELLGRPYFEVMTGLTDQDHPALFRRVWEQGEPAYLEELAVHLTYHAPGEVSYFSFIMQPLRDEQGQVRRIACVAVEVTDQVRARQQVQQLNQELQAANAHLGRTNTDLGTFVYTASHDLKAPITNIEGLLNALRDTLPAAVQQDEVIAHLLGLLDATVGRFLTTIAQLTDLSRLQRAYEEPAAELALAPVVAGVLADLAPVIKEAGAALHVHVSAELHLSFAPASLRSIVYNLLSNAVKYRDPARPAQVQVRAERHPAAVVLTVRDNGLGLSESQQQRLFGMFQRLHTHVEGTGVGLYMIKRLIENAGATIAVSSTLGVGTTFTVTFPA